MRLVHSAKKLTAIAHGRVAQEHVNGNTIPDPGISSTSHGMETIDKVDILR